MNGDNTMSTIKQYTTVYHAEYGKGYILNIKYRHQNNLLMCSFSQAGETVFITERQLRAGNNEVTLEPPRQTRREEINDELEKALRSLFTGG